jgi:hypothetical protein
LKSTTGLFLCSVLLLVSCSGPDEKADGVLANLADTLQTGESREIVLTTGTGLYYYDDAFGSDAKCTYGLSLFGKRALADWELHDDQSQGWSEPPIEVILHPEYINRLYADGRSERIECIAGEDAISIRVSFPRKTASMLRIWRDDVYRSTPKKPELIPGLSSDRPFELVEVPETRTVTYPESRRRGENSVGRLRSELAWKFKPSRTLSIVLAFDPDSMRAVTKAESLVESRGGWLAERRRMSDNALGGFVFHSEESSVERALALARLTLAGLYFTRNGHSWLYAGIPDSPWLDGFQMPLASVGLNLTDSTRAKAMLLFQTLVRPPLTLPDPAEGRVASLVNDDSASFSTSMASGSVARVFHRIISESDSIPLGLPTALIKLLDADVTCRLDSRRLVAGTLTGPGLFRTIGFPPEERKGAAIEVQASFLTVRQFLLKQLRSGGVNLITPEPALRGESVWKYWDLPPLAFGVNDRQFRSPLNRNGLIDYFRRRDGLIYNRLFVPEFIDDPVMPRKFNDAPEGDSVQTAAQVVAMSWIIDDDRRDATRLLSNAVSSGLIAPAGLRSLGLTEPGVQNTHPYLSGDSALYADCSGDVLIWTAGMLADLYNLTGKDEALKELFDELCLRILAEGCYGGLAESENAIPQENSMNVVRNPLFASSLAEFIRIFYDHILGVDSRSGGIPTLRLRIPKEWGKVDITVRITGVWVHLNRLRSGVWQVVQNDSEEEFILGVETFPDENARAMGSLKLSKGKIIEFSSQPLAEGRWTIYQKQIDEE